MFWLSKSDEGMKRELLLMDEKRLFDEASSSAKNYDLNFFPRFHLRFFVGKNNWRLPNADMTPAYSLY